MKDVTAITLTCLLCTATGLGVGFCVGRVFGLEEGKAYKACEQKGGGHVTSDGTCWKKVEP